MKVAIASNPAVHAIQRDQLLPRIIALLPCLLRADYGVGPGIVKRETVTTTERTSLPVSSSRSGERFMARLAGKNETWRAASTVSHADGSGTRVVRSAPWMS